MKKRYAFCGLAMLCNAAAMSQPTITADQFNYLSVTDFSYRSMAGNSELDPGPSGANVQWNFANIGTGSTVNYTTTTCPGDPDCGSFPGANQVIGVGGAAKVYYNKTNDAMEQIGEKAAGTLVYSNPLKVMQFPISYGQSFTDAFTASNGSETRNGTLQSSIDGWGTLTTPVGTYSNVLRQKIVQDFTLSVMGQNVEMRFTEYYWIAPGFHHYLMAYVSVEYVGVPAPSSHSAYYTTKTSNVSIKDYENNAEVQVYPVPATDYVQVNAGHNIQAIAVFNTLGQKVMEQSFNGRDRNVRIAVNQLPAGNYFINARTESGSVRRQIVVQ
jgi:hypothetical protein